MPLFEYKPASRSISARPRRPTTTPDSPLINRVHHKYSAANRCVTRTLTLESSVDGIKRLLSTIANGCTQADCHSLQLELQRRIQDDLSRRKFYQLAPERAKYFGMSNPFGESVSVNFRSAAYDIHEACNCYACDRFDATVYH